MRKRRMAIVVYAHTRMITIVCLLLLATVHANPCLSPPHYPFLRGSQLPNHWWLRCLPAHPPPPAALPSPLQPACPPELPAQTDSESSLSEELTLAWQIVWIIAQQLWEMVREWGLEVVQSLEEAGGRSVEYDDNFASLNGGAMVLRKSSSRIHLAQAILEDSSDRYLYTDEQLPIEVTIALKEEVSVHRVRLRSSEIYSSTVKDFMLEGAFAVDGDGDDPTSPQEHWFKLLEARARPHGSEQEFRTTNKVIRFLRLRILSKYGDWKYFTLTQLKVYGRGLFAEAMTDYQQVHSVMGPEPEPRHLLLEDGLGEIYRMAKSDVGKKPDQNMLTFLIERVDNLSRVEEHQILYMNNLTVQLERLTREKQQQEAVNRQLTLSLHEAHSKNRRLQQNNDAFFNYYVEMQSLKQKIRAIEQAQLTQQPHSNPPPLSPPHNSTPLHSNIPSAVPRTYESDQQVPIVIVCCLASLMTTLLAIWISKKCSSGRTDEQDRQEEK